MDPKFAEQFHIAHPTPKYAALLAALPAWFVGSEERLVPLVELLCAEMSAAFRATGASAPRLHVCRHVCGLAHAGLLAACAVCSACRRFESCL